jgi:hypothetical protein
MFKLFLAALILLLVAISCHKPVAPTPGGESAVSKILKFEVGRETDYAAADLDKILAEVKLTVAKMNKKTGVATIIWDTSYSLQPLRDYQEIVNPHFVIKEFTRIMISKEWLHVSKQLRLQHEPFVNTFMMSGESLPDFTNYKLVRVNF